MTLSTGQSQNSLKIFRAVKADANTTSKPHVCKRTMRPPSNVPDVVDNLWEWKRPDGFPCRRTSVCASPTPELAIKASTSSVDVFRVKFSGRYRLAQVQGKDDAKEHDDCRQLCKQLLKKLGQGWLDSTMREKEKAGILWMPCLRKEEVEALFNEVGELKAIRNEIWEAITFWNDVALIREGSLAPDQSGEFFFEAEDGYRLEPI